MALTFLPLDAFDSSSVSHCTSPSPQLTTSSTFVAQQGEWSHAIGQDEWLLKAHLSAVAARTSVAVNETELSAALPMS